MKAIIWFEDSADSYKNHKYMPKQVCYAKLTDNNKIESFEVKKIKREKEIDNKGFELAVDKYFGYLVPKIKKDGVNDIYIRHDIEYTFLRIPFYYAEKNGKTPYEITPHVMTNNGLQFIAKGIIDARTHGDVKIVDNDEREYRVHNRQELTIMLNSAAVAIENGWIRDMNTSYYGDMSVYNNSIELDALFATRPGGKIFHTRNCETFYKFIKSGKQQYDLFGHFDVENLKPCPSCIKNGKFKTSKGIEFDFTAQLERIKAEEEERNKQEAEQKAQREAERAKIKEERRLKNEEKRLANEKAKAEKAAKLEQERLAKEEAEHKAKEEAERIEAERLAAEKAEAERLEQERLEAERLEQERLEQERLEAERLEAERLEQERLEAERKAKEEAERIEAERLAKEEAERLAAEAVQQVEDDSENDSDTEESEDDTVECNSDTIVEIETSIGVKYKGLDPLGVALIKICSKYGMYCELRKGGNIGIKTASGTWNFNYIERPIKLMHMNYDYKSNSVKFKQYHEQATKFESPLDIIEYIIKHDNERINRLLNEYNL